MSGPRIFARLTKVDEEKRLVFGRIAQEVVDKSNEIMDYAKSVPYFKAWSAELAKDTDGKSLGNVRAMHGKVAAGVLKALDFNDSELAIDVSAHIVDDQEWKKCLSGTYTGFSIGGSYVGDKSVEKVNGVDVTRYVAKPNEVSLVDRPCIPSAKFFQVQKADGSTAEVEFQVPLENDRRKELIKLLEPTMAGDDPAQYTDDKLEALYAAHLAKSEADASEVEGTPEQVGEMAKLLREYKLGIGAVNKMLRDVAGGSLTYTKAAPTEPAALAGEGLEKFDTEKPLRKNMYCCGQFSQVLASLISLKQSAAYEAYVEGDSSPLPGRIGAVIALAGEVFKELIDEALAENAEGTEAPAAVMAMAEPLGGLAKYEGDPLLALLKAGARNSAADKDRIAAIHKASVELGADCSMGKAATVDDLLKADISTQVEKLVADATAPLTKALQEATAKIEKLEAQPAPATVRLRAVSKGEDFQVDDLQKINQPEPVKDSKGEVHDAASLIKGLHATGGLPLTKL